jgi:hypothetical protein
MRRLVSALCVALAVVFASAALTSFWLQQTVFSPQRAETAARQVLQNPSVIKLVTDQATQALTSALPAPVIAQLGPERIQAVVGSAARDPQVTAALAQTVAHAYRDLVTSGEAKPIVVDGGPMARAMGASLAQVSPQLGQAVAASPMRVEVRSQMMADLAQAKKLVDTVFAWCTGLALLCAAAGLVVSKNRPGLLQHLGGWLIGVAAVQLVLAWALPTKVLPRFGSTGELLGQIAAGMTGGVVTVLVVLLVAGAGGIVAGRVWSAGRRSARSLPPSPQPQPAVA